LALANNVPCPEGQPGRCQFCKSVISSMTFSLIREIVCLLTDAP
jgi:hypothetical protein